MAQEPDRAKATRDRMTDVSTVDNGGIEVLHDPRREADGIDPAIRETGTPAPRGSADRRA